MTLEFSGVRIETSRFTMIKTEKGNCHFVLDAAGQKWRLPCWPTKISGATLRGGLVWGSSDQGGQWCDVSEGFWISRWRWLTFKGRCNHLQILYLLHYSFSNWMCFTYAYYYYTFWIIYVAASHFYGHVPADSSVDIHGLYLNLCL